MRKLPANPGLNQNGETYSCFSRDLILSESLYFETYEGKLFVDFLSHKEDHVYVMDKLEVLRLMEFLSQSIGKIREREEW